MSRSPCVRLIGGGLRSDACGRYADASIDVLQILFTKTRILSTKIGTLDVFRELVKVLDKTSLTQKLVPLLAKIKTKEADVMVGEAVI